MNNCYLLAWRDSTIWDEATSKLRWFLTPKKLAWNELYSEILSSETVRIFPKSHKSAQSHLPSFISHRTRVDKPFYCIHYVFNWKCNFLHWIRNLFYFKDNINAFNLSFLKRLIMDYVHIVDVGTNISYLYDFV